MRLRDRAAHQLETLRDRERCRRGHEQAGDGKGRGDSRHGASDSRNRGAAHRGLLLLSKVKRAADPYLDRDVIDSRAPRFNQAVVGILAAVAVATGWWWLLALLAAQLVVGLTFGRRFCVPCLAYFELVQPHVGEGPLE